MTSFIINIKPNMYRSYNLLIHKTYQRINQNAKPTNNFPSLKAENPGTLRKRNKNCNTYTDGSLYSKLKEAAQIIGQI